MDLLTYSIERMGICGQIICRAVGSAPWGIQVAEDLHAPFYFMQAGSAWIEISDQHKIHLDQGDLLFLPHGHAHRVVDHVTSEAHALFEWETSNSYSICPIRTWSGEGIEAQILCGVYRLDYSFFAEMILEQFPTWIHIQMSHHQARHIRPALQLLLNELNTHAMGGHRVVMHTLELLLIKSLRVWIASQSPTLGWLNATREPHISQAVATLLQRPEEQWTVASIAQEVNMSRASFAREFLRLVGQPPLTFLTTLRMNLASYLLTIEGESITSIGIQVGYKSEAAFTRAFKKHFGVPPSRYRVHHDQIEGHKTFLSTDWQQLLAQPMRLSQLDEEIS